MSMAGSVPLVGNSRKKILAIPAKPSVVHEVQAQGGRPAVQSSGSLNRAAEVKGLWQGAQAGCSML